VLRNLLARDNIHLQIYVRSCKKLLGLFPDLIANPRASIYEDSLYNVELMEGCLPNAEIIFFCLGENENIAGTSVIEDGAKTVITALRSRSTSSPDWKPVRLITLSSST